MTVSSSDEASRSRRVLRVVRVVEDTLLVMILAGMVVLAGAQIVARNILESGMLWADPALRVMVLWVGLIGAMVATRYDKQISVDAVSRFLSPRWKAGVRVVTDLFTAAVSSVVAWNAWRLVQEDRAAGLTLFASVPMWVCELILPVAFAVIGVRYLVYALQHLERAWRGGAES
jgi:TRAP-type C4-dicarboxylate transport system permease small subunit